MFLALGIFGFPFGVKINGHSDLHQCLDEGTGFRFRLDNERVTLGGGNPPGTVYPAHDKLWAARVNVSNDDEQFFLP